MKIKGIDARVYIKHLFGFHDKDCSINTYGVKEDLSTCKYTLRNFSMEKVNKKYRKALLKHINKIRNKRRKSV